MAMALYSQCFAISAVLAPLLAGALFETQRHGAGLWMGMATLLLAGLNPLGANMTSTIALFPSQITSSIAGRKLAGGVDDLILGA
jgi:hypothetical protein